MLTAFAQAFRTPDLRRKLLFTLGIIAHLPRGLSPADAGRRLQRVKTCLGQVDNNGLYNLVNLFSGGALLQLSVFALGIMPYITASIIVQLLTVVIPRFEALKKEGQSGTAKLTQYTRYLTVGPGRSCSPPAWSRSPASPGALFQNCSAAPRPERLDLHPDRHGPHDDRRHRGHHVARRADHRPRHRQRHVAADLHLDHRALPAQIWQIQQTKNTLHLRHGAGHRASCSWRPSSSSSRPSAGSRCSTPSG